MKNHYDEMEEKQTIHRNEMICQCTQCSDYFVNRKALNHHYVEKHPETCTFKCGDCNKPFVCESDLKSHKKKAHTLKERFDCIHCENSVLRYSQKRISPSSSLKIRMYNEENNCYSDSQRRRSRC